MTLVLGYGMVKEMWGDGQIKVPIDPASLAGRVYYLCDWDGVLEHLKGLGTCTGDECRGRLCGCEEVSVREDGREWRGGEDGCVSGRGGGREGGCE